MIRRITGIILGVLAFLLVYWLTGAGDTIVAELGACRSSSGSSWRSSGRGCSGCIMVRRVKQNRQNEIDKEVQDQLAKQQNNPPA